jgi:GT2 family glycosyltransferase
LVRLLQRHLPQPPARLLRRAAAAAAGALVSDAAVKEPHLRRMNHMREVCGMVSHFVAPSQSIRDRFVDFGVAPSIITVADNGTDTSALRRRPRTRSGPLRAAFIGTLMISKGAHVLLRAVHQMQAGTIDLDVVGRCSPYHGDDSYHAQLDALKHHPAIRLVGPLNHDRIPEVLDRADVVVVPSIWPENSPVVIHEAFAAGVPVVASRIGGIPELVDDGRNGLLFTPGDVDDLARVLTRLVYQPGLLDALREGIPDVRTLEEDAEASRQMYVRAMLRRGGRIAAVVLNYRTPEQTLLAVRSLLASDRPIDPIVVVDNDVRGTLDGALSSMPRVRYVRSGRNLGFSGGVNLGIREGLDLDASCILLVNSDAIVPPDTAGILADVLDSSPAVGIAGPVILERRDPGRVASMGMTYRPRMGRMRLNAAGTPHRSCDSAALSTVDGVTGCVMLVRRQVFETAGLFDERYFFGFEDLEFCLRAGRQGWRTVVARAAVAYHEGGTSIGADSPRRLYFAARNHLLLAAEMPAGPVASIARSGCIVALNAAHALTARGGTLPQRLAAVTLGTADFLRGRFGADHECSQP